MELVFKLVTVCAVATLSAAQLNYNNPSYIPEYIQTQSSQVEAQLPPADQDQETANINFQQLPKPDAPKPFFATPLSTILKAPTEDASITNFNLQNLPPVPAQDLQLPSLVRWNPNDDPNLYYPVVVDKVVPLEIPTGLYPKKYNKNSEKEKSAILKLKSLVDDSARQDPLKTLYNIAKQDNKNLLKLEKLENGPPSAFEEEQKVNDPVPAESAFGGLSSDLSSSSHGAGSFGDLTHSHLSHGLGGPGGDRMEFHVQGHDGPKSYKWGFDTGKGIKEGVVEHHTASTHNRHFRYEEKDKHGYVKGHYGYYDKHGKLRMVHYDAHPHDGFHANGDIGHN